MAFKKLISQVPRELQKFNRQGQVMRPMQPRSEYRDPKRTTKEVEKESETGQNYPRKIFSGIKPTGAMHVGNYFGALKHWIQLQNLNEQPIFCIADMHAETLPQDPLTLRERIFEMAATMLACGIEPEQSVLFVQSSVKEHTELCWILSCLTTVGSLGHQAQYKEKTRQQKDIPLGLFIYPILQAADIMLYKATDVPIGKDQIQHIELAQQITRNFNNKYGATFPVCNAVIKDKTAACIRSMSDPHKKMSKTDIDPRACINLTDEPDVMVDKIKRAASDFISDVTYAPDIRPGISNLIAIHSLCTGKSIDSLVSEARTLDTNKYKMQVAEEVVEHLKPLRTKISSQLTRRNELIYLLDMGADKARLIAQQTVHEVKQKVGLGAMHVPLTMMNKEDGKTPPVLEVVIENKRKAVPSTPEVPYVPKQSPRIEKKRSNTPTRIGNYEFKIEAPLSLTKKKSGVSAIVPKAEVDNESTNHQSSITNCALKTPMKD